MTAHSDEPAGGLKPPAFPQVDLMLLVGPVLLALAMAATLIALGR